VRLVRVDSYNVTPGFKTLGSPAGLCLVLLRVKSARKGRCVQSRSRRGCFSTTDQSQGRCTHPPRTTMNPTHGQLNVGGRFPRSWLAWRRTGHRKRGGFVRDRHSLSKTGTRDEMRRGSALLRASDSLLARFGPGQPFSLRRRFSRQQRQRRRQHLGLGATAMVSSITCSLIDF